MNIFWAVTALVLSSTCAWPASLQVVPVLLDVATPAATATLTVRNTDLQPITVQIRVFRWSQSHGQDRLEPTNDVVASPPIVALTSRQDYLVRIARVGGGPVVGQESYRLVIDELPRPQQRPGAVSLVLRHVVPLFFSAPDTAPARIAWNLSRHGKTMTLSAANSGDARTRLAAVSIQTANGRVLSVNKGLLGYALGRSSMRWTIPMQGEPLSSGARVVISGLTETGRFDAPSSVQTTP